MVVGDLGQEVRRLGLELLEEDAVGRDLAQRLTVGRARHGDARSGSDAPWRGSRITRTSWQKYLPPNCAPMPSSLRELQHLLLELEVAESRARPRIPSVGRSSR